MALVRSLTVSKTNNCLLAAAGTFCNKCIQLSVLLISPKWSICCTEKDCLSGSRKDNREKHMERKKREEHRSDGAFGSLNSTCIKAGEKQDLWWWWGGESGAYVIWILERGKIGQFTVLLGSKMKKYENSRCGLRDRGCWRQCTTLKEGREFGRELVWWRTEGYKESLKPIMFSGTGS